LYFLGYFSVVVGRSQTKDGAIAIGHISTLGQRTKSGLCGKNFFLFSYQDHGSVREFPWPLESTRFSLGPVHSLSSTITSSAASLLNLCLGIKHYSFPYHDNYSQSV